MLGTLISPPTFPINALFGKASPFLLAFPFEKDGSEEATPSVSSVISCIRDGEIVEKEETSTILNS